MPLAAYYYIIKNCAKTLCTLQPVGFTRKVASSNIRTNSLSIMFGSNNSSLYDDNNFMQLFLMVKKITWWGWSNGFGQFKNPQCHLTNSKLFLRIEFWIGYLVFTRQFFCFNKIVRIRKRASIFHIKWPSNFKQWWFYHKLNK